MPGFLHAVLVMQYFQCSPGSHNFLIIFCCFFLLFEKLEHRQTCRFCLYMFRWEKRAGFSCTCTGGKSVQVLPVPVQVGKVCRFCLYLYRWEKCAGFACTSSGGKGVQNPMQAYGWMGQSANTMSGTETVKQLFVVSIAMTPITCDSQFLRLLLAIML